MTTSRNSFSRPKLKQLRGRINLHKISDGPKIFKNIVNDYFSINVAHSSVHKGRNAVIYSEINQSGKGSVYHCPEGDGNA